jgi:hypothetical protein
LVPPPELLHAHPKAQKQNADRLKRNQSLRRTAKPIPEAPRMRFPVSGV